MCFEELHERVVCTFPCQHAICLQCLLSLQMSACPLCRRDLTTCLPLRARLPTLQFVRRRLFVEDLDLHAPLHSRSAVWLGHFPRDALIAPIRSDGSDILREPPSPPSEEEPM